MPSFKGINVSLISQHGILKAPEYDTKKYHCADTFVHALEDDDDGFRAQSLREVYCPALGGSQFWIRYDIEHLVLKTMVYFRLFLDGKEIVSWGVGQREGWMGKVLFGLKDAENGLEKRLFMFGPDPCNGSIELRAYRARSRRRVPISDAAEAKEDCGSPGFKLLNVGKVDKNHPTDYYQFTLRDPLDKPFVTFRYHMRTWDQLEELGFITPSASISDDELDTCSEVLSSEGKETDLERSPLSRSESVSSSEKFSETPIAMTLQRTSPESPSSSTHGRLSRSKIIRFPTHLSEAAGSVAPQSISAPPPSPSRISPIAEDTDRFELTPSPPPSSSKMVRTSQDITADEQVPSSPPHPSSFISIARNMPKEYDDSLGYRVTVTAGCEVKKLGWLRKRISPVKKEQDREGAHSPSPVWWRRRKRRPGHKGSLAQIDEAAFSLDATGGIKLENSPEEQGPLLRKSRSGMLRSIINHATRRQRESSQSFAKTPLLS